MLSTHEIKTFINEDKASERKQRAKKGLDYYESKHDIKKYKVYYFDEDGKLQEDQTKANERISHPFFTELTDQCVQYMLSGKDRYIKSDVPELQTELDKYFDDEFKAELNELLTYTGVEGFSYLYRYLGSDDISKFKFADGLDVVEVPAKYASDKKDYIIYWYFYKKEKNKNIYKIEVWDKEKVYFYEMVNDTVRKDKTQVDRYHIEYEENGQRYGETFDEVPFMKLQNNRREKSDLVPIKDLIDDYDLMACGLSNNIQDLSEGYFVVRGFQGHDMTELTQAIRVKKQIGVNETGDVDIKTVAIPTEARKTKLELDEKNIYRFGFGFDSSKAETSNVTNMVIKSRYALLDLKANKKEMQLKKLLKNVIRIVVDEINKKNNKQYSPEDVYIDLERVVPSNETDNANIKKVEADTRQVEINTILNIKDQLDDETVVKRICEVMDIDYEDIKDRLEDDTQTPQQANMTLDNVTVTEEDTEDDIRDEEA